MTRCVSLHVSYVSPCMMLPECIPQQVHTALDDKLALTTQVYDMNVQCDLMHLVKRGCLPPGCKAEWFIDGKRIVGSSTDKDLPDNLSDDTEPMIPLSEFLHLLIQKRDGCAEQFQGLHAFYSVQQFWNRTGIALVDLRNVSNHGKCVCDGCSNGPKYAVRRAANADIKLSPGCRGLVLYLAANMKKPKQEDDYSWMKFSKYIFAYYPEEAFAIKDFKAKQGYAGSSKDHFYSNAPTGNCLTCRNRWCGCSACMNSSTLWSTKCTWTDIVGPVRHCQLQPALPFDQRPRPQRMETIVFEEFCCQLYDINRPVSQQVVACRRHPDDIDPDPPGVLIINKKFL